MIFYIKGGMLAEGILKQDPEVNIWPEKEWEWGVENVVQ